jgi:hypothetical protein
VPGRGGHGDDEHERTLGELGGDQQAVEPRAVDDRPTSTRTAPGPRERNPASPVYVVDPVSENTSHIAATVYSWSPAMLTSCPAYSRRNPLPRRSASVSSNRPMPGLATRRYFGVR